MNTRYLDGLVILNILIHCMRVAYYVGETVITLLSHITEMHVYNYQQVKLLMALWNYANACSRRERPVVKFGR